MVLLGDKLLIKKIEKSRVLASGLTIGSDKDDVPVAEVVLVSPDVEKKKDVVNIPKVGDEVHYILPREKGRCTYKGEEHFIVPLSSAIAIL